MDLSFIVERFMLHKKVKEKGWPRIFHQPYGLFEIKNRGCPKRGGGAA